LKDEDNSEHRAGFSRFASVFTCPDVLQLKDEKLEIPSLRRWSSLLVLEELCLAGVTHAVV